MNEVLCPELTKEFMTAFHACTQHQGCTQQGEGRGIANMTLRSVISYQQKWSYHTDAMLLHVAAAGSRLPKHLPDAADIGPHDTRVALVSMHVAPP